MLPVNRKIFISRVWPKLGPCVEEACTQQHSVLVFFDEKIQKKKKYTFNYDR